MSRKTLNLNDALYRYLLANSLREPDILAELRKATSQLPVANMQISPEQGQLMSLFVRLTQASTLLEIGTFTGYSTLAMALALPTEGRIITCDINEEWTTIAKHYWQRAEVADKIDLRIGPALDTLNNLIERQQEATFDMAFIDANKTQYNDYYEATMLLVKSNGLILIDNTLWGGKVADETVQNNQTQAIRALNTKLHHDERIDLSLLPISDGLTLVRKR